MVTQITPELRRLVDDMFETMEAAKGVGLAAPQVGRSERLCVVDADDVRLVVINPEIIHKEGGIVGEVVHIGPAQGKDGAVSLNDRITIKSGESKLVVERGRIAAIGGAAPTAS